MHATFKTEASGKNTVRWEYTVGFLLIVLSYFIIRLNLINIPLTRDEGGFAYLGSLAVKGGMLYRNGIDHTPPGLWLIYGVFYYLVPFTASGLHWLIHIYNFISMFFLSLLSLNLFNIRTCLWTALIYSVCTSSPSVEGSCGSAEMVMLLPIILTVFFSVYGFENRNIIYVFFAGFISAMAFWIKQPALVITLFVIGYIFFAALKSDDSEFLWLFSFFFSSGFFCLSFVIAISFYINGVWDEFIYWTFTHSISYASSGSILIGLNFFAWQIINMLLEMPVLWIALFAFVFSRHAMHPNKYYMLIGFLISSFIAAAHSTAMYRHYFALLCPSLALCAGTAVSRLIDTINSRNLKRFWILGAITGLLIMPVLFNLNYYWLNTPSENNKLLFGQDIFYESASIAEYLRKKTTPDDRILILGSEPQILVFSNRQSTTRHIYMYPVVGPYKRSPEFQNEVIEDIKRHPPAYIVNVKDSMSWVVKSNIEKFKSRLNNLITPHFEADGALIIKNNESRLLVGESYTQFFRNNDKSGVKILAYILKRKTSGPLTCSSEDPMD